MQKMLADRYGHNTYDKDGGYDLKKAGEWLYDLINCISNELEELRNCIYWKHWCKEAKDGRQFEIRDLENAKIEVVDILHFFLEMCLCLKMNSNTLFELYTKKNEVNHERQDTGYSMDGKTEDDNQKIIRQSNG
jgi:dimeric dUTPase (all-alpha-NTP-PPase superfamily)